MDGSGGWSTDAELVGYIAGLRKDVLDRVLDPRGADADETRRLVQRFDGRSLPPMEKQPELYAELVSKKVLAVASHEPLYWPGECDLDAEEQEHIEQYHELPPSVVARLADTAARNECILEHILALAPEERVLVFAARVPHAHFLAKELMLRGRLAAAIDGSTPGAMRRYLLGAFRDGTVPTLVNYGVLTTGFDEPSVTTVFIARPTFSPVLYAQMIGRGLRGPAMGGTESCRIITVADNFRRFGEHAVWAWFKPLWEMFTP